MFFGRICVRARCGLVFHCSPCLTTQDARVSAHIHAIHAKKSTALHPVVIRPGHACNCPSTPPRLPPPASAIAAGPARAPHATKTSAPPAWQTNKPISERKYPFVSNKVKHYIARLNTISSVPRQIKARSSRPTDDPVLRSQLLSVFFPHRRSTLYTTLHAHGLDPAQSL